MAEDDEGSSKENPKPGSVVSAAVEGCLRGVLPAQLLIRKPDSVIVGAPP